MQNHSWIHLDKILFGEDSCNSIHEGQFPDEWLYQWALGIKTMLLIPFLQQGVLQLGSLEEVSEDLLVVSYIKSRFVLPYAAPFPKNKNIDAELSSLMYYNSVDELDETSTITFCPSVSEESTEIDDVRLKMNNSETDNQVVPLFTTQDTFYVYGNNQPEFLEMVESEQPELSCLEELHYIDFERIFDDFSVTDFYSTMDQPFKDEDFLGFPKHSELHKALGPTFQGHAIENSWDSSFLVEDINGNLGLISGRDPINSIEPSQLDAGYLLEAMVDNKFTGPEKKSGNRSVGPSISSGVRTSVSKQQPGNDCLFMESKKGAKPSKVRKIKAKPGENQKPRPRDRQMIQDRLKEIREVVPNGKNCSIDGLLDRTIRHMLYLRSVTDQAGNLEKWTHHEATADLKSRSTKINDDPNKGTSWVFELGKGHQVCPIVVEDLPLPGFLLIEMLCDDHSFFLEITSEILRLKLTILKGATETRSGGTWAYFVVEASKGFHRMDIFWPLMNLLQRQRYTSRRKLDVL